MLPATIVMIGAIGLYGLGILDVLGLGVAEALHLVIGWVFLVVSPFYVPRQAAVGNAKGNF